MIKFTLKHPGVNLGFIPSMLNENDPLQAREQLNIGYSHGGGWRPMKGFTMLPDGKLKYPGDSPLEILAEAQFRKEIIRFYESEFVAIIQPDGSFEASRMN